ncbi:MAG: carbon monoxide dehydrogenase [Acidimicrobiaceae bacterium]|nr:carbon monoxide dehydrogenase [Acidimicrobiaceae bacterium]|tara:strand:- start:759 stop:1613 length:855 start_codon:yes stop_codon:yes gene_type:complete
MEFLIATTSEEVCTLLAEDPARKILAGGTDFMVEVNFRHRDPTAVIAIDRVPELRQWRHDGDSVLIGSCVTYREIERGPLSTLVPALAQSARTIGSPQIRNAGTIGGNLGTASPAGDMIPVLLALNATVTIRSISGSRTVSIDNLITGVKKTSLAENEFIESVKVPILRGSQEFLKVGPRNAMVISIASLAMVTDMDRKTIAVALGSVTAAPCRATEAEKYIENFVDWETMTVDSAAISTFRELVSNASSPITDHRSSANYRRHTVSVLGERALLRIFEERSSD